MSWHLDYSIEFVSRNCSATITIYSNFMDSYAKIQFYHVRCATRGSCSCTSSSCAGDKYWFFLQFFWGKYMAGSWVLKSIMVAIYYQSGFRLVSHSQTLFLRRGAITFSISAPLVLKAITLLCENRVWPRETSFCSGVSRSWSLIDPCLTRGLHSCLCHTHCCTVKHHLEHPCIKHCIICWAQIQLISIKNSTGVNWLEWRGLSSELVPHKYKQQDRIV